MQVADITVRAEAGTIGREMHQFVTELYPICRSITGDGVRETLRQIGQHIPLTIREVASGTEVFDWTVPKEWNIRDAYVKNSRGERVIDFRKHNLHVMSYSVPVRQIMSLSDLKAPSAHSSRTSGLDPVSDFLLQRKLGLLPHSPSTARSEGRRIRSLHRFLSGEWSSDLRRVLSAGRDSGRNAGFQSRLPSFALQ